MIDVKCPKCGKPQAVDDKYAGRSAKCSKCKAKIDIPRMQLIREFNRRGANVPRKSMAKKFMKPCVKCGHLVNKSARKCPDCGASQPGDRMALAGMAAGLFALVVAVFALAFYLRSEIDEFTDTPAGAPSDTGTTDDPL